MDSETASFVMGASAHLDEARKLRRKTPQLRSAGFGGYGLAAYGYPLGSITGVQGPPADMQQPTDAPLQGDQFGTGDSGATAGADGGAGTS